MIEAAAPPEGAAALIAARGPAAATSRPQKSLQLTTHPQADERLDKSIVPLHRDCKRRICTSGMTARHSTLFTLGSGHSGLGFYTTQRDAAAWAGTAGLRSAAAVLQRATAVPWRASASRRRPPHPGPGSWVGWLARLGARGCGGAAHLGCSWPGFGPVWPRAAARAVTHFAPYLSGVAVASGPGLGESPP